MIIVSSCSCLCPIHWSQVLSRERRCSWSNADRRCFNYISVIHILIDCWGASYARGLAVPALCAENPPVTCRFTSKRASDTQVWCFLHCWIEQAFGKNCCRWVEMLCHSCDITVLSQWWIAAPNWSSVWGNNDTGSFSGLWSNFLFRCERWHLIYRNWSNWSTSYVIFYISYHSI